MPSFLPSSSALTRARGCAVNRVKIGCLQTHKTIFCCCCRENCSRELFVSDVPQPLLCHFEVEVEKAFKNVCAFGVARTWNVENCFTKLECFKDFPCLGFKIWFVYIQLSNFYVCLINFNLFSFFSDSWFHFQPFNTSTQQLHSTQPRRDLWTLPSYPHPTCVFHYEVLGM